MSVFTTAGIMRPNEKFKTKPGYLANCFPSGSHQNSSQDVFLIMLSESSARALSQKIVRFFRSDRSPAPNHSQEICDLSAWTIFCDLLLQANLGKLNDLMPLLWLQCTLATQCIQRARISRTQTLLQDARTKAQDLASSIRGAECLTQDSE